MLQAAPDAMRRSETIKMHTDLDASQAKASKDLTPHRRQNGMLLYIFGIGPENTETGAPGSRLIYPLSKFGLAWIVLTSLFLMYTGIVTPPLIAFHWTDDECAVIPTLYFDVGLDCFFLADIILTFFTGTFVAGEYIDDFQRGAILYLRGSFLFDCVTSFPVSFFELMAKAACESNTTGEVESGQLRMIRAIKPIRFVKILRIMKVSKAGPLIHMMMDYWNISPKQGKTLKLGTVLIMAIHLMACAWWFFKVLFMTFEEINQFLDDQAWGRHERHSIHTPQGKIEAYIISLYVTTMTITTVGYGDISADNSSERVGYIALFIAGALIWGNLLAGLGEIHQAARPASATRKKWRASRKHSIFWFPTTARPICAEASYVGRVSQRSMLTTTFKRSWSWPISRKTCDATWFSIFIQSRSTPCLCLPTLRVWKAQARLATPAISSTISSASSSTAPLLRERYVFVCVLVLFLCA